MIYPYVTWRRAPYLDSGPVSNRSGAKYSSGLSEHVLEAENDWIGCEDFKA